MSIKNAYEKKLQSQLDEWNADIDKLKAKAEHVESNAQLEYYKRIEELRSMQHEAYKKLKELQDAGDGAWEDLKTGIESAWHSLGNAVRSAIAQFELK